MGMKGASGLPLYLRILIHMQTLFPCGKTLAVCICRGLIISLIYLAYLHFRCDYSPPSVEHLQSRPYIFYRVRSRDSGLLLSLPASLQSHSRTSILAGLWPWLIFKAHG